MMRVASSTVLVAALYCTCEPDSDHHVLRVGSAGVEIVTSESASSVLDWRADTLLLIGGKESGPEGFYRVRAALADIDALGRIFVLNDPGYTISVFDDQGRFLTEMAGEGGGPGELRWPLSISVSERGEVSVHDAGKGSIVRYGSNGEPLAEQPFESATMGNRLRQIELTPSGTAVWLRDQFKGTDQRWEAYGGHIHRKEVHPR